MDKYRITGGRKLYGTVSVQSAKNAVLPMLAAGLLTDRRVELCRCPAISDIENLIGLLRCLGVRAEQSGGKVTLESIGAKNVPLVEPLTGRLRASVLLLGPMLGRFGAAALSYPGGCAIGARPIDLHLSALSAMGAKIETQPTGVICTAGPRRDCTVVLPYPSVGATENVLLYGVCGPSRTVLKNAAKEPEIVDLQRFLNAMGGKIHGAGTGEIVIEGVEKLRSVSYTPMFDRIEAGTFLTAAACCGGEVCLEGAEGENLSAFLDKLRENGCKIWTKDDKICLESSREHYGMGRIETGPYPAFPTDLQPLISVLAAVSRGKTEIFERVFERRFAHFRDLKRMGATVECAEGCARVYGGRLHAETVTARDLRGGAALVVAALVPEGTSEVLHPEYIDRGYADLDKKLSLLGAAIERIT